MTEAAGTPKYLYHGTKKKNLDDILKNGLRVEFNESNIEWQKATYLACDTYTAANYAGHKGAKSEDWAVLQIEISKLREDLLRPDDYDFPDMWGRDSMHEEVNAEIAPLKEEFGDNWADVPWEVSLQVCCQVAYLGDIPPTAIKVIPTQFPSLEYSWIMNSTAKLGIAAVAAVIIAFVIFIEDFMVRVAALLDTMWQWKRSRE